MSTKSAIARASLVGAVVIATALLASVQYWSAIALAAGIASGWALTYLIDRYRAHWRTASKGVVVLWPVLGIIALAAAIGISTQNSAYLAHTGFLPGPLGPETPPGPGPTYSNCTLSIRPLDIAAGMFRVQPTVVFSGQVTRLPFKDLPDSGPIGPFAREVDIAKPSGAVQVPSGPQRTVAVTVDFSICPEITVELSDFPAGAFYAARNAAATPTPQQYVGSESTQWKVPYTDDPDIRFSYLPPPKNDFAYVLDPIRPIYSLPVAAIYLGGLVLTAYRGKLLISLLKFLWARIRRLCGRPSSGGAPGPPTSKGRPRN